MKIKNLIVLAALLAFAVTSRSQDASTLLMKSRSRCLELNKVYYEMTQWFKPMTDRDTLITASKCWLKQGKGDLVFGCFFHYEYIVNGKSAIDWIMERYQITTHKDSGIKNDPNDWAKEVEKPRYILDLLLSVINLSIQTVDIVNALPPINFDKV